MGRTIHKTYVGAYIEIMKEPIDIVKEIEGNHAFRIYGNDYCVFMDRLNFEYPEEEQSQFLPENGKIRLSGNLTCNSIQNSLEELKQQYKEAIRLLIEVFGKDKVALKVGIVEYSIEIA